MNTPLTVTDDRKGDLAFQGELLAGVSTRQDTGPKAWNWSTIEAYRTSEGRFLLVLVRTIQGIEAKEWQVFSTRREAQEWLRWGALPMSLYTEAGWPI